MPGRRRVKRLWDIYPVDAVNLDDSYVVLMNDVGQRLQESDSFLPDDFKRMYRDLWQETVAVEDDANLCHGDIGEHNLLLLDDHSFRLIDWDEASNIPLARDPGRDMDARMRHPEIFRRQPDRRLYTSLQLALLHFRLSHKYCQTQNRDHPPWNPSTTTVVNAAGVDVLGTQCSPRHTTGDYSRCPRVVGRGQGRAGDELAS